MDRLSQLTAAEIAFLVARYPAVDKAQIQTQYDLLAAGTSDVQWDKLLAKLDSVHGKSAPPLSPVAPSISPPTTSNAKRKIDELEHAAKQPDVKTTKSVETTAATYSKPIKEVVGDLFGVPSINLAHCISADAKLGKGIAAVFVKKFGGKAFKEKIRTQGVDVGGVAVVLQGTFYIYNLVTKKFYHNKPTYDSLRASLEKMREHAEANKVTAIAMPRIGCGLDGLKWSQVRNMLNQVFGNTKIQITVYSLA